MALVATPKSATANSYLTEVEATAYMTSERLNTSDWSSASIQSRERALIYATRLLDDSFDWVGYKRTLEQALRWPRSGALDSDSNWLDYDTIPDLIKRATAEVALALLIEDLTAEPGILGQGISEAQIGDLFVKIDPTQRKQLIPQRVINSLTSLGTIKPTAAGSGSFAMKVERT